MSNVFYKSFSYTEIEAIKVIDAKNALNETITEQGIKLNEIDDLKIGADIHAEDLEKRVCLNYFNAV